MAEEALIESARTGEPDPVSEAGLFNRRIDFHVARRPFNGFSNGSSNGFKLVTLNPNSGIHQASGSGKKSERPEHLDSMMDPELGLEITFRRIGAGLRNLGNTCFLNSVLQCLTYTEPLAAYLQSGRHQSSCRTAGFCALCAIQKHVSRALQATGRILEPKDLVSNLRCISRNFRNARQEDAHEYMVNLLESMHKCCLPSGVPSESPGAYEKSLVHKIFGGRLRSQVKCVRCSFCSNKFDPFLDLSLEILKADSLQKALCHFTAKEHLDGGAMQYQCQHCKQKVKALKQLTVYKAPLVLAVHLKRFGHIHGQKIDKKISFGSTLDLKPFVSGSYEGDLKYTLYGVLVHAGWSTHSGHYFCFVRTSSGMWYSLDDNQVVQVSEKKVLEQKAYMLFYVRDRKSVCRKKPVDILQKENVIMNAIGKSAFSKFDQDSNEKVPTGSTEVNRDASTASTSRDRVAASVPKDNSLEKIALPNANGKVSLNHLNCKSLPGIPIMQPERGPCASKINDDGPQAESISTFEVPSIATASVIHCNNIAALGQNPSSAVLSPDNSSQNNSHPKKDTNPLPSVCSNNITEESPSVPVSKKADGKAPCATSRDKGRMDEDANDEMPDGKTVSMRTNVEVSDQPNSAKFSNQNSTTDNPVAEVGHKSDAAAIEETRELKVIATNKRSRLKVKRKLLKGRAATLALSSSIIFGSVFSVGKKNHKRRKQHSTRKVSCNLSPLCGNDLPSSIDQSLPGKSSPPNEHFTRLKKKAKHGLNDKDINSSTKSLSCNGSNPSDIVNNDYKERSIPSDATTAADIHEGPSDSAKPGWESREKDVMSMLTRGLEETIVARWDDIGSASAKTEIRSAAMALQIGYIGDEWDEEYDKGKRKKVRNAKITYGEPNPFQQIASRNSKRERAAEREGLSSENPPFRI